MPLYNVNTQSALERSQQSLSQAIQAATSFTKKGYKTEVEKTAGGAALSAISMGATGAVVGSSLAGAGAKTGAVVGAGTGAAATTAGGSIAGGAAAGGSVGAWWGAAIGAIVGLGAYLLS